MKKLLTLLLCMSIIFALCACNDSGTNTCDTTGQNQPSADTDAPSDDLVQRDLATALEIENKHAHIKESSIIKSLTNEGTFSVSLSVKAETNFVDCEYEVDMSYTKYDQGWMLDNTQWTTISHQIARFPDEASMAEYVAGYLPSHEIYDTYWSAYLLPVDEPSLLITGENTLSFSWTGTETLLHSVRKHRFTSQWEYSPEIDNWIIMGDSTDSVFDLEIEHNNKTVSTEPNYNLSFNGIWTGETNILGLSMIENAPDAHAEINISNFSWDGFDADINYVVVDFSDNIVEGKYISHYEIEGTHTENSSNHFTRVGKPDHNVLAYCGSVWFKSENGDYIVFEYREDETELRYFRNGAYNAHILSVQITQELPPL